VRCLTKESFKSDFIKQAVEKLKQADKFLGTGQWFAGDRVRFLNHVAWFSWFSHSKN